MADRKIKLGNRRVGVGEPLYFIADIAANHDGKLERALKLIELAKEAGADAAKFQNFQAHKIVSARGFNSLCGKLSHQSGWKKPVFEVYKDASIPLEWAPQLKAKCAEAGIEYFTSPYDFESVDAVDPYVNIYKIGSGDIDWDEMLTYIAQKGKPVIIASGASCLSEVRKALKLIEPYTQDIILLQCNTNYTAGPENFRHINLNVLKTFSREFPGAILGLSDHTRGYATVLGAVALGALVFEKHFTDDNSRDGPDHAFAMDPRSWKEMIRAANETYQALGDGVKRVEDNERQTVFLQRRSLRFTRDLPKGHIVLRQDIFPLRPAEKGAYGPGCLKYILGKMLVRNVLSEECVREEDLSDA
jgi:N-acetylneuraminate synthase